MCGVSRQGAWPTPGSRPESYAESRRPSWRHGIGSSEAGRSEGSTHSHQRLLGASHGLAPGEPTSKMQSEPSSRSNFPASFLHKYQVRLPPLFIPPHPLIPCPFVWCLWQICAFVLNLHPRNPSRRKLLTAIPSHPKEHRERIS